MSGEESLYTAINGINQLIIDTTAALPPPPLSHHVSSIFLQFTPRYFSYLLQLEGNMSSNVSGFDNLLQKS